jgi:hypothetical protein
MGGRKFVQRWIIALLMLAGGASCSDSREASEPASRADAGPDRDRNRDGDGADRDEDGDQTAGEEDDGDGDGASGGSSAGDDPARTLPTFPGAGTSDAGDPLPNGMLCDSVPGEDLPIADGGMATCFFDKNTDDPNVAATLEQVLECVEDTDTVHIRLTFHPWFVDNTYGVNSIGWPPRRGHRWTDLTKSDHAEIILKNGAGEIVLRFKLDYVTEDPSAPSGYGSLGVTGGDGSVLVGDASAIVKYSTSIDRNLNERGYGDYLPDSPATDEDYTANTDAPEWDFRVVYEAWIDLSVFGDEGFGGATIEYVHASPAKAESDTIETEPGDCPPPPCVDNDPDTDCAEGGGGTGGGGDPCADNDPDTFCGGGGVGGSDGGGGTGGKGGDPCADNDPDTVCDQGGTAGGGDPQYCEDHPSDPACMVD